jgi:hypothetical protein
MARFTVRVELQNNEDGHEVLDRAMEAQGFTRIIRIQGGGQYHLPTAEYRMSGRHTRAKVCGLAKAGVAETGCEAAILVTEGECSWHNLRRSVPIGTGENPENASRDR